MRNVESDDMITVTPRQLEGIIRLSTARARLLMKDISLVNQHQLQNVCQFLV